VNAPRAKAYLQLVRVPNTFTAAADVTAGLLLGGAGLRDGPLAGLLIAGSMSLYAGGVALNDVCDHERDRASRPERPIPSGLIPRAAALKLSLALLVAGFGCAVVASPRSSVAAAVLVCSIMLYDYLLKETPAAPLVMGVCRTANLAMGLFALEAPLDVHAMVPLGIMWLYVTGVTLFARDEASGGSRLHLAVGSAGVVLALAALLMMSPDDTDDLAAYTAVVVGLTAVAGVAGARAARTRSPRHTQRAVTWFVSGIVLLDACLAWSAAGPVAGALVAAWLLPVAVSGRVIRLT